MLVTDQTEGVLSRAPGADGAQYLVFQKDTSVSAGKGFVACPANRHNTAHTIHTASVQRPRI